MTSSRPVTTDIMPPMWFAVHPDSNNPHMKALLVILDSILQSISCVLDEKTPEAIDFAIDEVLDSQHFQHQYINFVDLVKRATVQPTETEIESAIASMSISSSLQEKTLLALKYSMIISVTQSAHAKGRTDAADTHTGSRPLLWFLEEWSCPVEMKSRMLGLCRAEVALLLFIRAVQCRSEEWKKQHLICLAYDGYKRYAELLASFPDFNISDSAIPVSDRLDLSALTEAETSNRIAKEIFIVKYNQGGQVTYAPYGEIAGDED